MWGGAQARGSGGERRVLATAPSRGSAATSARSPRFARRRRLARSWCAPLSPPPSALWLLSVLYAPWELALATGSAGEPRFLSSPSECRLGAVQPQGGHLEARHRASCRGRVLHSAPLRTGGAFATTSGGTAPAFSAAAEANQCAWRADRLDFHGFLSRFEPFRSASPATPDRLPLAY